MKTVYYLPELTCANCASKIESALGKLPFVESCILNFTTKKVILNTAEPVNCERAGLIRKTVLSYEDVAVLTEEEYLSSQGKSVKTREKAPAKSHTREEACGCGHGHGLESRSQGRSCDCGHSHEGGGDVHAGEEGHEHGHSHQKAGFQGWLPLITGAVLFTAALFIPLEPIKMALFIAATAVAGFKAFAGAFKGLFQKRIDENLLMCIAVIAAFAIGIYTGSAEEFAEGAMVTLLFVLGEYLEGIAVSRSQRQIAALTSILPEEAVLLTDEGEVKVSAKSLEPEDMILIRPGERVPVDCVIQAGACMADTSVVTGESVPREMEEGSELLSGMVNLDGLITCRVSRPMGQSAAARIIEMVEESARQKGSTERFITRFARVYTPAILAAALLVAFIPPLLSWGTFPDWIYRALVFLVASCPCALVISVPLSFFSAIGAASKRGILVKGGKYIELLAKAKNAAFDKTGTLTQGKPSIGKINCYGELSEQESLEWAALAESYSSHPVAKAITGRYPNFAKRNVESMKEHSGYGLELRAEGHAILCGSEKLLSRSGICCEEAQGETVLLSVDGKLTAGFVVEDQVKTDAARAVEALKSLGIKQVLMVSGDNEVACAGVAGQTGVTDYAHSCMPQDKVERVKKLKESGVTLFAGDGINDAPVLAAADAGIAMGLGSQAAIDAADVVLMSDKLTSLPEAVSLSRRSMGVIRFNVAFALIVKFAVLILALTGQAQMWMAVFADVGVSILSVLNASRILLFSEKIK